MAKIVQLQSPNRPRSTIGQMRDEIIVQSYGDAPFGDFSLERTYTVVATTRGRVTNISGSAFRNGMALDANVTHMIVIRKPEFALTTENMIEWVHAGTNERLRIRQVRPVGRTSNDPREQFVMMLCESQGLVAAFKDPSPETTPVTLVSLAITGPASVLSGASNQYTLTGTYSNASTRDHTAQAIWDDTSGKPLAVVGGLLVTDPSAVDVSISVYATYGGLTTNIPVTVTKVAFPTTNLIQHLATPTVDGTTLPDSIGTYTAPKITPTPVMVFDGDGDGVYPGRPLMPETADFQMDIMFNGTDRVATGHIVCQQYKSGPFVPAPSGLYIYWDGSGVGVYYNGSLRKDVRMPANEWYHMRIIRTGALFEFFTGDMGGTLVSYGTFTAGVIQQTVNTGIGRRVVGTANAFQGMIALVTISGPTGAEYHFEEEEGETCYDVSGNGHHGTITTTSGSTTMRAATADGVPSYNDQHGFREV